ncbi:hypothetical protein Anapl_06665 [Anas platyrhynchos]|uniref:Uncharacterized protein n=1 Tax=Anas platyrhynchos TaxID=8839 RepID=R0JCX8_ANAPL|nr:hypothetical protein Anapl_06665 [Anas platyrhynchos]
MAPEELGERKGGLSFITESSHRAPWLGENRGICCKRLDDIGVSVLTQLSGRYKLLVPPAGWLGSTHKSKIPEVNAANSPADKDGVCAMTFELQHLVILETAPRKQRRPSSHLESLQDTLHCWARTQAEKLPAVMNQQRELELLVTERNCQEFGKAFSSFLPQNLLVPSSLEPEELPAGGHKQEGARPGVPQGSRCSQGVKFNSGLTVASSQSCLLSPEPLNLFLAQENNSLHRSQMLKEPTKEPEAGDGITQDLCSSALEHHLATICEGLENQQHLCKTAIFPYPRELFLQLKLGSQGRLAKQATDGDRKKCFPLQASKFMATQQQGDPSLAPAQQQENCTCDGHGGIMTPTLLSFKNLFSQIEEALVSAVAGEIYGCLRKCFIIPRPALGLAAGSKAKPSQRVLLLSDSTQSSAAIRRACLGTETEPERWFNLMPPILTRTLEVGKHSVAGQDFTPELRGGDVVTTGAPPSPPRLVQPSSRSAVTQGDVQSNRTGQDRGLITSAQSRRSIAEVVLGKLKNRAKTSTTSRQISPGILKGCHTRVSTNLSTDQGYHRCPSDCFETTWDMLQSWFIDISSILVRKEQGGAHLGRAKLFGSTLVMLMASPCLWLPGSAAEEQSPPQRGVFTSCNRCFRPHIIRPRRCQDEVSPAPVEEQGNDLQGRNSKKQGRKPSLDFSTKLCPSSPRLEAIGQLPRIQTIRASEAGNPMIKGTRNTRLDKEFGCCPGSQHGHFGQVRCMSNLRASMLAAERPGFVGMRQGFHGLYSQILLLLLSSTPGYHPVSSESCTMQNKGQGVRVQPPKPYPDTLFRAAVGASRKRAFTTRFTPGSTSTEILPNYLKKPRAGTGSIGGFCEALGTSRGCSAAPNSCRFLFAPSILPNKPLTVAPATPLMLLAEGEAISRAAVQIGFVKKIKNPSVLQKTKGIPGREYDMKEVTTHISGLHGPLIRNVVSLPWPSLLFLAIAIKGKVCSAGAEGHPCCPLEVPGGCCVLPPAPSPHQFPQDKDTDVPCSPGGREATGSCLGGARREHAACGGCRPQGELQKPVPPKPISTLSLSAGLTSARSRETNAVAQAA